MSIIDDRLEYLGLKKAFIDPNKALKDLIYKYLDSNYKVVKYKKESYFPPKDGCLLYSKYNNEEISWGNFNRDLATIFSIHSADAKYFSADWYTKGVRIAKQANQGFKEIQ